MSRLRADAAPSFVLIPEPGAVGEPLTLGAEESRYVARVCRARVGETLSATDGRGARIRLTLLEVGTRVIARLDSIERLSSTRDAVVWCGAPEGTRADWMVEKLAEIGIASFQPIDCARAKWRPSAARLDRWQRLAEAALRQSRQTRLMRIEPPRALRDVARSIPPATSCWLADPEGGRNESPAPTGPTLAAVGPSQGFDPAEMRLFSELGFKPISLSEGRLRTESAALSWAAWWASHRP